MSKVDQLLAWASQELGRPYVYGAEGPNTFDCSGLMQYIFGKIGISLPRTSQAQQQATTPVSNPLPGDLVFYGRPAYHVGLYIGGGKMISAPHTGAVVHVTPVGTPTNYGRVAGLGAGLAPITGTLTGVGTQTVSLTSDILGGARNIVLEGVVVLLGLGLIGYGAYRVATPARKDT